METIFYVRLSWYALRASLVPSCHEHRLVEFSLLFLIYINFHGDYFLRASFLVRIAGGGAAHHMVSFVEIEESKPPVGCTVFRRSCKTSGFCYVDVAVCIEEAAKRRAFFSVDVAVSIGEAAQHRVLFAT